MPIVYIIPGMEESGEYNDVKACEPDCDAEVDENGEVQYGGAGNPNENVDRVINIGEKLKENSEKNITNITKIIENVNAELISTTADLDKLQTFIENIDTYFSSTEYPDIKKRILNYDEIISHIKTKYDSITSITDFIKNKSKIIGDILIDCKKEKSKAASSSIFKSSNKVDPVFQTKLEEMINASSDLNKIYQVVQFLNYLKQYVSNIKKSKSEKEAAKEEFGKYKITAAKTTTSTKAERVYILDELLDKTVYVRLISAQKLITIANSRLSECIQVAERILIPDDALLSFEESSMNTVDKYTRTYEAYIKSFFSSITSLRNPPLSVKINARIKLLIENCDKIKETVNLNVVAQTEFKPEHDDSKYKDWGKNVPITNETTEATILTMQKLQMEAGQLNKTVELFYKKTLMQHSKFETDVINAKLILLETSFNLICAKHLTEYITAHQAVVHIMPILDTQFDYKSFSANISAILPLISGQENLTNTKNVSYGEYMLMIKGYLFKIIAQLNASFERQTVNYNTAVELYSANAASTNQALDKSLVASSAVSSTSNSTEDICNTLIEDVANDLIQRIPPEVVPYVTHLSIKLPFLIEDMTTPGCEFFKDQISVGIHIEESETAISIIPNTGNNQKLQNIIDYINQNSNLDIDFKKKIKESLTVKPKQVFKVINCNQPSLNPVKNSNEFRMNMGNFVLTKVSNAITPLIENKIFGYIFNNNVNPINNVESKIIELTLLKQNIEKIIIKTETKIKAIEDEADPAKQKNISEAQDEAAKAEGEAAKAEAEADEAEYKAKKSQDEAVKTEATNKRKTANEKWKDAYIKQARVDIIKANAENIKANTEAEAIEAKAIEAEAEATKAESEAAAVDPETETAKDKRQEADKKRQEAGVKRQEADKKRQEANEIITNNNNIVDKTDSENTKTINSVKLKNIDEQLTNLKSKKEEFDEQTEKYNAQEKIVSDSDTNLNKLKNKTPSNKTEIEKATKIRDAEKKSLENMAAALEKLKLEITNLVNYTEPNASSTQTGGDLSDSVGNYVFNLSDMASDNLATSLLEYTGSPPYFKGIADQWIKPIAGRIAASVVDSSRLIYTPEFMKIDFKNPINNFIGTSLSNTLGPLISNQAFKIIENIKQKAIEYKEHNSIAASENKIINTIAKLGLQKAITDTAVPIKFKPTGNVKFGEKLYDEAYAMFLPLILSKLVSYIINNIVFNEDEIVNCNCQCINYLRQLTLLVIKISTSEKIEKEDHENIQLIILKVLVSYFFIEIQELWEETPDPGANPAPAPAPNFNNKPDDYVFACHIYEVSDNLNAMAMVFVILLKLFLCTPFLSIIITEYSIKLQNNQNLIGDYLVFKQQDQYDRYKECMEDDKFLENPYNDDTEEYLFQKMNSQISFINFEFRELFIKRWSRVATINTFIYTKSDNVSFANTDCKKCLKYIKTIYDKLNPVYDSAELFSSFTEHFDENVETIQDENLTDIIKLFDNTMGYTFEWNFSTTPLTVEFKQYANIVHAMQITIDLMEDLNSRAIINWGTAYVAAAAYIDLVEQKCIPPYSYNKFSSYHKFIEHMLTAYIKRIKLYKATKNDYRSTITRPLSVFFSFVDLEPPESEKSKNNSTDTMNCATTIYYYETILCILMDFLLFSILISQKVIFTDKTKDSSIKEKLENRFCEIYSVNKTATSNKSVENEGCLTRLITHANEFDEVIGLINKNSSTTRVDYITIYTEIITSLREIYYLSNTNTKIDVAIFNFMNRIYATPSNFIAYLNSVIRVVVRISLALNQYTQHEMAIYRTKGFGTNKHTDTIFFIEGALKDINMQEERSKSLFNSFHNTGVVIHKFAQDGYNAYTNQDLKGLIKFVGVSLTVNTVRQLYQGAKWATSSGRTGLYYAGTALLNTTKNVFTYIRGFIGGLFNNYATSIVVPKQISVPEATEKFNNSLSAIIGQVNEEYNMITDTIWMLKQYQISPDNTQEAGFFSFFTSTPESIASSEMKDKNKSIADQIKYNLGLIVNYGDHWMLNDISKKYNPYNHIYVDSPKYNANIVSVLTKIHSGSQELKAYRHESGGNIYPAKLKSILSKIKYNFENIKVCMENKHIFDLLHIFMDKTAVRGKLGDEPTFQNLTFEGNAIKLATNLAYNLGIINGTFELIPNTTPTRMELNGVVTTISETLMKHRLLKCMFKQLQDLLLERKITPAATYLAFYIKTIPDDETPAANQIYTDLFNAATNVITTMLLFDNRILVSYHKSNAEMMNPTNSAPRPDASVQNAKMSDKPNLDLMFKRLAKNIPKLIARVMLPETEQAGFIFTDITQKLRYFIENTYRYPLNYDMKYLTGLFSNSNPSVNVFNYAQLSRMVLFENINDRHTLSIYNSWNYLSFLFYTDVFLISIPRNNFYDLPHLINDNMVKSIHETRGYWELVVGLRVLLTSSWNNRADIEPMSIDIHQYSCYREPSYTNIYKPFNYSIHQHEKLKNLWFINTDINSYEYLFKIPDNDNNIPWQQYNLGKHCNQYNEISNDLFSAESMNTYLNMEPIMVLHNLLAFTHRFVLPIKNILRRDIRTDQYMDQSLEFIRLKAVPFMMEDYAKTLLKKSETPMQNIKRQREIDKKLKEHGIRGPRDKFGNDEDIDEADGEDLDDGSDYDSDDNRGNNDTAKNNRAKEFSKNIKNIPIRTALTQSEAEAKAEKAKAESDATQAEAAAGVLPMTSGGKAHIDSPLEDIPYFTDNREFTRLMRTKRNNNRRQRHSRRTARNQI